MRSSVHKTQPQPPPSHSRSPLSSSLVHLVAFASLHASITHLSFFNSVTL